MKTLLTMTIAISASLLAWPTNRSIATVQDAGKSATSNGAGDLGTQIKAGVMLGLIERDDARDLAKAIMELEGERNPRKPDGGGKNGGTAEESKSIPVWAVFALPGGGALTTLLEPEYLPRDAAFLTKELAIDAGASAIVETLLDDYTSLFERERREVLDAVAAARRASAMMTPEIDAALASVAAAVIDRDAAMDDLRAGAAGKGGEADPASMEKWIDWAVAEAAGLQRRVAALQAIRAESQGSTESPERASAAALGRALAFRMSRDQWRRAFEEDLAAVVPAEESEMLARTLARLRSEHGRRRGRFGGDSIDLDAAWQVTRSGMTLDDATIRSIEAAIERRCLEFASLVDARTLARIATELAALRGYLEGLAGDPRGVERAARTLEDAADVQVSAELAVRDLTLMIAEELTTAAAADSPTLKTSLRSEIRQRAFPQQMRPRWSEKAIDVTLGLEDLDDEQRAAVLSLAEQVMPRTEQIRERAIEERLRREVRIARAMAEAIVDDFASAKSMDEETWEEPEQDDFERLDSEVGAALRRLLSPAQLERLPPHVSIGTRSDAKSASGKSAENKPRSGSGASGGGKG